MNLEEEKNKPTKVTKSKPTLCNIKEFDKYYSIFVKDKRDFEVLEHGTTKHITLLDSNSSYVFLCENYSQNRIGIHLVKLLKNSVVKFTKRHGKPEPIKHPLLDKYSCKKRDFIVQSINLKGIKESQDKEEKIGIDINHCYWRIAHKLGYINFKTYQKGLKRNYKIGRLIANGALYSTYTKEIFSKGQFVKRIELSEIKDMYGIYYENILKYADIIMLDLFENLQDKFLFYLTDCAFVTLSAKQKAIEIFKKYGMKFKTFSIDINSYDTDELTWFSSNPNPKPNFSQIKKSIEKNIKENNITENVYLLVMSNKHEKIKISLKERKISNIIYKIKKLKFFLWIKFINNNNVNYIYQAYEFKKMPLNALLSLNDIKNW